MHGSISVSGLLVVDAVVHACVKRRINQPARWFLPVSKATFNLRLFFFFATDIRSQSINSKIGLQKICLHKLVFHILTRDFTYLHKSVIKFFSLQISKCIRDLKSRSKI